MSEGARVHAVGEQVVTRPRYLLRGPTTQRGGSATCRNVGIGDAPRRRSGHDVGKQRPGVEVGDLRDSGAGERLNQSIVIDIRELREQQAGIGRVALAVGSGAHVRKCDHKDVAGACGPQDADLLYLITGSNCHCRASLLKRADAHGTDDSGLIENVIGTTPESIQGPWIGDTGGLAKIGAHLARDRRDIRRDGGAQRLIGSCQGEDSRRRRVSGATNRIVVAARGRELRRGETQAVAGGHCQAIAVAEVLRPDGPRVGGEFVCRRPDQIGECARVGQTVTEKVDAAVVIAPGSCARGCHGGD